MSEATYRVTLTHKPENGTAVCWHGEVYDESEFEAHEAGYGDSPPLPIFDTFRATREDAFDSAQAWCKAKASEPQAPSTVFLTEDGELIDRHEVGNAARAEYRDFLRSLPETRGVRDDD